MGRKHRLPLLAMLVVAAALSIAVGPASAFERTPYTNALIAEARETRRPYVLFVHADWCTTCQAQDRILETLIDDPRFANLLILTIDFDTKRNLMMLFNVPDRSTFIAFSGAMEIGRSVWDTTPEGITAFLQLAVDASPNYVPASAVPAGAVTPAVTPPPA
ncbi:MAG: thioredoxin family protein [Bauldia sp.]